MSNFEQAPESVGIDKERKVITCVLFAIFCLLPALSTPLVASAEKTEYVGVAIDQVFYTKRESSLYTCPGDKKTLSLSPFKQLFAAIGIINKPNAVEAQNSCDPKTWPGSGGTAFKSIESSFTLKPFPSIEMRRFIGATGSEFFSRTDTNVTVPRYGGKTCVITHTYKIYPIISDGKTGGSISNLCSGATSQADSPPYIPVNPAIGHFNAVWKGENFIENYAVSENSRSQLTVNGVSKNTYKVTVTASAEQMIYDAKSRLFNYVPIPCKSLRVNGKKPDKDCRVILTAHGPVATFDITPKAAVSYYAYSVFADYPQLDQPKK